MNKYDKINLSQICFIKKGFKMRERLNNRKNNELRNIKITKDEARENKKI